MYSVGFRQDSGGRSLYRSVVPLHHIVWLQFFSHVSAESIDEHLQSCRRLPEQIPIVQQLVCGPNRTMRRAAGFTHGIIVTLPDLDSLSQYLEHPAHVPVAERLLADVADIRVMDLET
jgi:hypothetical protein